MILYLGHAHIKSIGYAEAEAKYALIIKSKEELINSKIAGVELLANSLVKSNARINTNLAYGITNILASTKGKPLTVIKDGKCAPSQTFSDSFVSITNQTNQAIRDAQ
jgi:hypothetical protein